MKPLNLRPYVVHRFYFRLDLMQSPQQNVPTVCVGWDYLVCSSWSVNPTSKQGMETSVNSFQNWTNTQVQKTEVNVQYWGSLSSTKEHSLCQGIVLFLQQTMLVYYIYRKIFTCAHIFIILLKKYYSCKVMKSKSEKEKWASVFWDLTF